MGGEKLRVALWRFDTLGSPPRGRGKVGKGKCGVKLAGITPAWAGKSCYDVVPRFGGVGSPPRGRGKACPAAPRCSWTRITPAWAGKSRPCHSVFALSRDHPRVGGEKERVNRCACWTEGSPPRGRGKAVYFNGGETRSGITPAWAGKRLKRSHRSGIFISGPIPFHSVLHRPAGSGSSRAGRDGSPAGQPQNAGPA